MQVAMKFWTFETL